MFSIIRSYLAFTLNWISLGIVIRKKNKIKTLSCIEKFKNLTNIFNFVFKILYMKRNFCFQEIQKDIMSQALHKLFEPIWSIKNYYQ